jgi:hypothetical protein
MGKGLPEKYRLKLKMDGIGRITKGKKSGKAVKGDKNLLLSPDIPRWIP